MLKKGNKLTEKPAVKKKKDSPVLDNNPSDDSKSASILVKYDGLFYDGMVCFYF